MWERGVWGAGGKAPQGYGVGRGWGWSGGRRMEGEQSARRGRENETVQYIPIPVSTFCYCSNL